MQVRTACQARDDWAPSRRREGARDRALDRVLTEYGHGGPRSLAAGERAATRGWQLVSAAAAGAALVPVEALGGRGAAHPRCPGQDELGSDAPAGDHRPPSRHDLAGAGSSRRLTPTAARAADVPPL